MGLASTALRTLCMCLAMTVSAAVQAESASGKSVNIVEPRTFAQLSELKGQNWTLEVVSIEQDFEWGAVFSLRGKELYRFGRGASKESFRFMLWPSRESPRFLCVYRTGGGTAGPYSLDVVDLRDGYRNVLSSSDFFQFKVGVADLNGDGMPEFIGRSYGFSCAPTMPWNFCSAEEPQPLVVMSYDVATKRFRSAAFLFAGYALKDRKQWEADFAQRLDAQGTLLPASLIGKENQPGLLVDLLQWTLELIYCGKEEEAWRAFNMYCEPPLAKAVKEAVQQTLENDEVYQGMLRYRKEKGNK